MKKTLLIISFLCSVALQAIGSQSREVKLLIDINNAGRMKDVKVLNTSGDTKADNKAMIRCEDIVFPSEKRNGQYIIKVEVKDENISVFYNS